MKYKGFEIQPHFNACATFRILENGQTIPRKPTSKDIDYYEIFDLMHGGRFCAEDTITQCKATINELLLKLNMRSNSPADWAKLED
jgi:ABC-type sugar transport system ATPase subunit